ncbi:MAG TPA: MarR family transcriptional regulator [Phycisphaerae bacterium]|nr:MarR family transcriptional regulator [Phycisphaerae bacterium]HPS52594.1 MarR family transcriptional regulator [Phycisphaerae bacterium]
MGTKKYNSKFPYAFRNDWHEALVRTWHTGQLLRAIAVNFFADKPVSDTQFNLMGGLYYSDKPPSQQELADRLVVHKSAISTLIDRMEQAGLVRRRSHSGDRRRFELVLTEKGEKIFKNLEEEYLELVRSIMKRISNRDITALNESLEKLRLAVNAYLINKE